MRSFIRDASPYANHGGPALGDLAAQSILGDTLSVWGGVASAGADGVCVFSAQPQYAIAAGQAFFVEGLARRDYVGRSSGVRDGLIGSSTWLVEIEEATARLIGNWQGTSGRSPSSATVPVGAVFSWAFGRTADGTAHLFLDGVHSSFAVGTAAASAGVGHRLGQYTQPGFTIDEVRLTIGTCRQTADYAPVYDAPFPEGATDPLWDQVVLLTHCDPLPAPSVAAAGAPVVAQGAAVQLGRSHAAAPGPARELISREHGGRGRITGTVKNKGTPNSPVQRRVRLYADRSGLLVDETWSDAVTGAYVFNYVRADLTYTVVSYDHTLAYRAVIADRVVPEAMPTP